MVLPPPTCVEMGALYPVSGAMELTAEFGYATTWRACAVYRISLQTITKSGQESTLWLKQPLPVPVPWEGGCSAPPRTLPTMPGECANPMKPPRSKLRGIRRKGIGDETPRFLMLFPLYGNP